jgi:D-beta-D-heptose 7-phosphate kinase/D-beta-D-heptose 1-phosphate adenosyltransferase
MNELLERIKSLRLFVIGDVMLDRYVRGEVSRISPEAPVPVLHVDGEDSVAGGAANVGLNAADLGASVDLGGVFGQDESGERLLALIAERGIACDPAFASSQAPTICKTRVMAGNQQICRVDREESYQAYAPNLDALSELLAEKARNADAVIVSDYAKGFVNDELLSLLRSEAKFLAVDPKPRRCLNYDSPDLMTPNKVESLQLAGLERGDFEEFPADAIAAAIHDSHRPHRVAVTLGADGMLLIEHGKVIQRIPTAAREVFDVSGAGDTVIAAMTLALAAQSTFEEASAFANLAAGVVVAKVGTATASPEEILAATAI